MQVLRTKSPHMPEDHEVFCGEEMKPFVALSGEEEPGDPVTPEATVDRPDRPEAQSGSTDKPRLWQRFRRLLRPGSFDA